MAISMLVSETFPVVFSSFSSIPKHSFSGREVFSSEDITQDIVIEQLAWLLIFLSKKRRRERHPLSCREKRRRAAFVAFMSSSLSDIVVRETKNCFHTKGTWTPLTRSLNLRGWASKQNVSQAIACLLNNFTARSAEKSCRIQRHSSHANTYTVAKVVFKAY